MLYLWILKYLQIVIENDIYIYGEAYFKQSTLQRANE